MQVNNRSGLQCLQHPNQQITNYCTNIECLTPLCPDCVQIHTKQHQVQQIQSWKHCVNKAARGVKATLEQLKPILQDQTKSRGVKTVDMIESENLKKLNQMKQRVLKIVKEVFDSLQHKLKNAIRSHYRVDQPDTTKLKSAIEELEKILMRLAHSTTVLPSLKKSLQLDHQSLLNFFKDMKYIDKRQIVETYIYENVDSIEKIRIALENVAQINKIYSEPIDRLYKSPYPNRGDIYDSRSLSPANDTALRINQPNYFSQDCRFKFLHFFIPQTQLLKILEIEQVKKMNELNEWRSLEYRSKTELPQFGQSIITPKGQIYMIGGALQEKRCKQILKYNHQKNSLDYICKMNLDRSSHTLCFINNGIYILGGFTKNGQLTKECEVFDLQTHKCSMIAPMITPSANSCATKFNNESIYKFGGLIDKINPNISLIQMYSLKDNKWHIINIEVPKNIPKLQLLSCSSAIQINEKQILVYGGYRDDEYQKPQKTCYAVVVNQNRFAVSIKNYNSFPLKHAQGFWSNNSIMHNNHVYALQNVTDSQNEHEVLSQERRVIIFNGQKWL